MLTDRLAISLMLIPVFGWIVYVGGWVYLVAIAAIFGLAAHEYNQIFRMGEWRPAYLLMLGAVPLLIIIRATLPAEWFNTLFTLGIVSALTWHLFDYERGAQKSATDFAITLAGVAYLGWLGTHLVLIRNLPDGLWWTATVVPAVWIADGGGYVFGRAFGRRKLAPRLSPKKTVEGFVGGILSGVVLTAVLAQLWSLAATPHSGLNWQTGALLGAVVGVIAPIGDLGISMLKRQTGVKDTGHLLAGHGGALDRIDSWIVAVPVGYYVILAMLQLK